MGIRALPFSKLFKTLKKPLSRAYPKEVKTIGDQIRKARLDRELLQKDVAQLIGVTEDCIMNWEKNRNKPQKKYYPKLSSFLNELIDRKSN